MRKVISLILAIFAFPPFLFAFDDGDWQYWNTEDVSVKFSGDWKLAVEEEFRYGDQMSNFYYNHTDLGLTYSGLTDWFDLGINYRHIYEDKSSDWKRNIGRI